MLVDRPRFFLKTTIPVLSLRSKWETKKKISEGQRILIVGLAVLDTVCVVDDFPEEGLFAMHADFNG